MPDLEMDGRTLGKERHQGILRAQAPGGHGQWDRKTREEAGL